MKKNMLKTHSPQHLEEMSVHTLLMNINKADQAVPDAVERAIPSIEKLIETIVDKMRAGGRLFYLGTGISGRLGVLDAAECPSTFGIREDRIIGIIAGGDRAIRKTVDFGDDNPMLAWKDLNDYYVTDSDVVVGISASGSTPYVMHGLRYCQQDKITTGSIACCADSAIAGYSDFPVEIEVGEEFISGSTRMKAGTALKLVLNMISTSVLVKLGETQGSQRVDMQLNNNKLIDRGIQILMNALKIEYASAKEILLHYGSVRRALLSCRPQRG